MKTSILTFFAALMVVPFQLLFAQSAVKIAVVGLTHSHVHWILGREGVGDVEIVGIVEPNDDLAHRLMAQYGIDKQLLYPDMESLFAAVKPEAVTAFGSIYEHLAVVQACAPRGIHVMVEKPLAVSMEHANEMAELAKKHQIHLLTNYETTWYASNHELKKRLKAEEIGPVRRVIVNDGHEGPMEIGVNQEFLDWLTDPVLNGGGAVIDFGCYGANLMTWLMDGVKPISVTAELKQIKPNIYPKVDDEATILLEYPSAQGVIQASWNWPFSRKDMEVYGKTGYMVAKNSTRLLSRTEGQNQEKVETLAKRTNPFNDPFAYLAAVVRGEIQVSAKDLSSIENNLVVVEILDAAIESAKKGKRIYLKQ
ncbi:Gfo/Idh/MocA family protein [Cyclobacterium marinum]|uniref:Oxidoreductase domain protein n=1 Tax=Cyclobacterium marinum (strain ATCC 25205 / DSM 745 / LMG 13164 / NCIMB 1802) TaxID=880070 RepID=G0J3S2_CYCMS|nr:Gfo/Idh/MocA family oxidoreductase [Cyclobacterium marinum]AEL25278.1 oxidoreductase domain protein [Cyclobacterium marinum DSM 745]